MKTRTRFTPEQKALAVERVNAGRSQAEVAKEIGAHYTSISNWVVKARKGATGKRVAKMESAKVVRARKVPADLHLSKKVRAFRSLFQALDGLSKQEREEVLSAAQILFQ